MRTMSGRRGHEAAREGRGRTDDPDLRRVAFVVLDLETTGTTPGRSAITEVGAVRYRGGERLAVLQTLVDPTSPISPLVTALTGIDNGLVTGAPSIDAVLPGLTDFIGDGVVVGHNVSFDRAFLDHELDARGYPRLAEPVVDTLGLARRLLAGEIPDHRLSTLARYLHTTHRPRHRALPDALATADVFHALLERVATFGVTSLDALLSFDGAVPGSARPGHERPPLPVGRP